MRFTQGEDHRASGVAHTWQQVAESKDKRSRFTINQNVASVSPRGRKDDLAGSGIRSAIQDRYDKLAAFRRRNDLIRNLQARLGADREIILIGRVWQRYAGYRGLCVRRHRVAVHVVDYCTRVVSRLCETTDVAVGETGLTLEDGCHDRILGNLVKVFVTDLPQELEPACYGCTFRNVSR